MLNKLSPADLYSKIWEQRPLFLSRHKPLYNDGWFSTKQLDGILREVQSHWYYSCSIYLYDVESTKT